MTYQVKLSSQASRFLKNQDTHEASRIIDKLKDIRSDPFRYFSHYEGNYYELRIGRFRALIDVDQSAQIINVQILDKRGRIFK